MVCVMLWLPLRSLAAAPPALDQQNKSWFIFGHKKKMAKLKIFKYFRMDSYKEWPN